MGKLNCMQQGGRLFTPRSTRAMEFFETYEAMHIGKASRPSYYASSNVEKMFHYATSDGRQAIGMTYVPEDPEGKLMYR